MIEDKLALLLGELVPVSKSHTHSKARDIEYIGPSDTDFRRGHSQSHDFGSFAFDAEGKKETNYHLQVNLKCCWNCKSITGERLSGLKCGNKKNTYSEFGSIEPYGFCSNFLHKGPYR